MLLLNRNKISKYLTFHPSFFRIECCNTTSRKLCTRSSTSHMLIASESLLSPICTPVYTSESTEVNRKKWRKQRVQLWALKVWKKTFDFSSKKNITSWLEIKTSNIHSGHSLMEVIVLLFLAWLQTKYRRSWNKVEGHHEWSNRRRNKGCHKNILM